MQPHKEEILHLMAKFRSRLDILWRIATRICAGDFPSGQTIGSYPQYDTPLLPLIGIELDKDENLTRPAYEDAIKIAFESIMADFYRAEALIKDLP